MPFITMRELLRDPKAAFSEIENGGEPFVVTRRGHPVAALVPIDPSRVETSVLAAAPEFAESRREAENARAEGRTAPLESLAQRLDLDSSEESETNLALDLDFTSLMEDLFGAPVAEELSTRAAAQIDEISQPVVRVAVAAGVETQLAAFHGSSAADRVRAINAELFQRALREVLAEAKAGVVASLGTEAVTRDDPAGASDEGLFGRKVGEEALKRVSVQLRTFNEQVVREISRESGAFSLSTYEATARGIGAFQGRTPGLAESATHQAHLRSFSHRVPHE